MAAGYVLVWALFSVGATGLQRLLAEWSIITMMMEPSRPVVAATLLIVAGVYQLTPMKDACLIGVPLADGDADARDGAKASSARFGWDSATACIVLGVAGR